MIDAHTVSIASFVSQATFALTFALLAWSDRRTRGMTWLAASAVLQLLLVSSRTISPPTLAARECAAASVLILIFFCVYMGLRWFAVRRQLRSRFGPSALALSFLVIVLLSTISPMLAMLAGRAVVLSIICMSVRTAWTTRIAALRVSLRTTAALLAVLGGILATRTVLTVTHSLATARFAEIMSESTIWSVAPLMLSFLALFVAETNRRLHDETRVDVLTGLRNRRALEEAASREARACTVADVPLSLLMMDLDHFKQLNDTWGHGLGDRALRAMGSILLTVIGEEALTARMGGEEFAVLLPGYELTGAATVAERVRATVEDLRLAEGDRMASFTVSIGVSVMQADERTWTDMMARADEALYRAKREGRNRVITAEAATVPVAPQLQETRRPSWRKFLLLPRQGPML